MAAALVAGPALAETLSFDGTLTLNLGDLPASTISGVGVATINSSGGGQHVTTLQLPKNVVTTSTTTTPTTGSATKVEFSAFNRAGNFTGGSGANPLHGPMPIGGKARLCAPFFINTCVFDLTMPLTKNQTRGIGLGGTITAKDSGNAIDDHTLYGAQWTVGTASITGVQTESGGTTTLTSVGFVHAQGSGTSNTARINSVLQLVTPIIIHQEGSPILEGFSTFRVQFVPEPHLLVLNAAGVAGLLVLGRLRRRREEKTRP